MEEFILNRHPRQNAPPRQSRSGRLSLARPGALNPKAYPAERPLDCRTLLRDSISPEHFLNAPYFRLRPPGPSAAGQPVFLTWILHESVPDERLITTAAPSTWKAFASVDRLLDEARTGPLYLRHGEIAAMVVETTRAYDSDLRHYDLHSFVVMPNHIHLLLTPRVELTKLTRIVKSVIAERANELLDQPGAPFWDEENWEHLVGGAQDFGRIRQYIERNPVPVGMAREAADYPYSSAARGMLAKLA
jgi:REP element-mobilizing transposase RayT